uniref:Uncharacterized protein n=1 Tax=Setaria viridis TaxID=4556 RepID=A0A4V6D537_SETVI|nr:hypothetical protein SEVIR_6G054000v2 [Setaria viridis]
MMVIKLQSKEGILGLAKERRNGGNNCVRCGLVCSKDLPAAQRACWLPFSMRACSRFLVARGSISGKRIKVTGPCRLLAFSFQAAIQYFISGSAMFSSAPDEEHCSDLTRGT